MDKLNIVLVVFFFMIYITASLFEYMPEDTSLNPFDYARITDVDYKAVINDEENQDGSALITEQITYDIHAASKSNLFWELWRDLCEDNYDGLDVKYDVLSVARIVDGKREEWPESRKLYWEDEDYTSVGKTYGLGPGKWYHSPGPYNEAYDRYEAVFFYIPGTYREKMTFEVTYLMKNAVLKYNDCSELYLSMYSEDTIKYLNSYNAQILFPDDKMPAKENYKAQTYGTNSYTFPYTESDTLNPGYHTFSFSLDKDDLKFNSTNKFIEFSLLSMNDDKHIFSQNANENLYTYEDTLEELLDEQEEYNNKGKLYETYKKIGFLLCIVIAIIKIIKTIKAERKIKDKYQFYKPETEFIYYRDIPSDLDPVFASELAFSKGKHKKKDEDHYSAIVLSLARKGYIEFVKIDDMQGWTDNNIKIVVKHIPKFNGISVANPNILNSNSYDMNLVDNNDYFANNSIDNYVQDLKQRAIKENYDLSDSSSKVDDSGVQDYTFSTHLYDNVTIEKDNHESLTPNEKEYFDLILKYTIQGTKEISMKSFQSFIINDYESTNSFVSKIKNSIVEIGINEKYFQKENYKEPRNNLNARGIFRIVRGILYLTVGNLICMQTPVGFLYGGLTILACTLIPTGIYFRKASRKYVLLTEYGENEYEKWYALYNFLNSETLMKERTVVELPLWEKYLVYATAFGISDKVVNAIKIRCPEANNSVILNNNSCYRSHVFRHSSHTFSRSVHTASHVGSYGSGGYGGGGRGGGGGRRRSLK